jgi:hypothetical protein
MLRAVLTCSAVYGFTALLFLLAGCRVPPGQIRKGSLSYMDAKYGFRGIKFGTPESQVVKRLHLEPCDNGSVAAYRRKDEKLRLGSVQLTDIRYRFLRNKFFGVTLVGVATGSPSLLEVVRAAYGRGACRTSRLRSDDSGRQMSKVCSWKGTKVAAEYKETTIELPVFSMWSVSLLNEEMADKHMGESIEKETKKVEAPEDL